MTKDELLMPRPVVPDAYRFEDDGSIPNNPRIPLLVYRGAWEAKPDVDLAAAIEKRFDVNGWLGTWRNGIYGFEHYHSLSHEVLAVYSGTAKVRLGGHLGEVVTIGVGDVLVIPAGVGHRNLGSSSDFGVIGAYPDGIDYDTLRGDPKDRPWALANIKAVPKPTTDPVYGVDGPLLDLWPED